MKCPCCNGTIAKVPDRRDLEFITLPKQQKTVLNVLIKAYPRKVSRNALGLALYSMDPNGGPDTQETITRILICRLRKRLSIFGWTISHAQHGRGYENTSYKLEKML